jgi:hypothetical protein
MDTESSPEKNIRPFNEHRKFSGNVRIGPEMNIETSSETEKSALKWI